jgi:uncharacterized membrane protein
LGGTVANGTVTIDVIAYGPATMQLSFGYPLDNPTVSSEPAIDYTYESGGDVSYIDVYFSVAGEYELSLSYTANMFSSVENGKYVYAPTFSFYNTVPKFSCKVIVPESMSVVSPLVPTPQSSFSEGSSLVVLWEKSNVENGLYLLLGLKEDSSSPCLAWYYIVLIVMFFFGIGAILGRRSSPHCGESSNVQPDFKTDEAAVIGILSERGPTSQGEIVQLTGFSKAKVSRIIMELEARNVIEKERYKNRIM